MQSMLNLKQGASARRIHTRCYFNNALAALTLGSKTWIGDVQTQSNVLMLTLCEDASVLTQVATSSLRPEQLKIFTGVRPDPL
jgi:hypothetical protein